MSALIVIKAGSPIAVMTVSFAFGLKKPSVHLVSIILLICAGKVRISCSSIIS